MRVSYKPANYNSVSPYLIVQGAQKMVDLLKELFGATVLRRYDHPDGTVLHMEMRLDDSVIMLADSNASACLCSGCRRDVRESPAAGMQRNSETKGTGRRPRPAWYVRRLFRKYLGHRHSGTRRMTRYV
jgi:hypothetical protein